MTEQIKMIAEWCAAMVEFLGVSLIAGLAIYTLLCAAVRLLKKDPPERVSKMARQSLKQRFQYGTIWYGIDPMLYSQPVCLRRKWMINY